MREQLALLRQLQDHDVKDRDVVTVLQSLPIKLQTAKRALLELERNLLRQQALLMENESLLASKEENKKNIAQQLIKSKSKLSQVRNLKESTAIQRELEANRRLLDLRDEESKQLAHFIFEQRKKVEAEQLKLQQYLSNFSNEEQAVDIKLSQMREQSEKIKRQRDLLTVHIDPIVLRRYESIRTLKKWPMVVSAVDGVCGGCHMRIFPQIYNNLHRKDSLESCGYCNRILFLDIDEK